jgi:spore germination cell wall hydrolase CwlJ-like protein
MINTLARTAMESGAILGALSVGFWLQPQDQPITPQTPAVQSASAPTTSPSAEIQTMSTIAKQIQEPLVKAQTPKLVKPNKIVNMITKHQPRNDVEWIATNIMFEAANQPTKGKEYVAYVTVNRVGMFGNASIQDSVMNAKVNSQGLVQIGQCHFSWVCDGTGVKTIKNDAPTAVAWAESIRIAKKVLANSKTKLVTVDHYVRCDIANKAWWKPYMKKNSLVKVADHCFYTQDAALVEANWKKQQAKKAKTLIAQN